ncbi:hypothetical protein IQ07DRAFT_112061 [Pyrenochaeta sp. DS3sAY3a]|nr:hypothetical protein IQ07DRAFT_112061 [Pyrenochaeta sp. DS3sAY3a]
MQRLSSQQLQREEPQAYRAVVKRSCHANRTDRTVSRKVRAQAENDVTEIDATRPWKCRFEITEARLSDRYCTEAQCLVADSLSWTTYEGTCNRPAALHFPDLFCGTPESLSCSCATLQINKADMLLGVVFI